MKKMFARISMLVKCTDEEYAEIQRNLRLGTEEGDGRARMLFWKCYEQDHEISMDSYLVANYNVSYNPNAQDFDLD